MEKVKLLVDDSGIARVTIDNPRKRNVLSNDVMIALDIAISEVEKLGEKVKALIVSSFIPEAFSAGGDIKEWYSYDKTSAYDRGLHGGDVFQRLEDLPMVTIAAISGSCLGGGSELALACDYRIATHDAKFGQPEVLLGNGPSWGGYYRLVKTVGLSKAKELIFFGETYSAKEALEMGLVNQLVSDFDHLRKTADELAEKASINSRTTAISKQILNQIGNDLVPSNPLIDGLSASYFAGTEDSNRRKKAFIDKRLNEVLEEELSGNLTVK